MRIAMDGRFLTSPVLRGMDRYVIGLVSELVRLGVRVTVFHRKNEPLHEVHLAHAGCDIVGLAAPRVVWWEQIAVPIALMKGRFDLYHAPAERGVPYLSPCPVVYTLHSATAESYRDLIRRGLLPGPVKTYLGVDVPPRPRTPMQHYYAWQAHRADHVLTPSQFSRDEIIRLLGLPPNRVTVTPLAADARFDLPPKSEEQRRAVLDHLGISGPYLLFVGGFEPHKNMNGLLQMFAKMRARQPAFSLVVVGSKAVPQEVLETARQLGVFDAVRFLPSVTDELVDLYDGATLLVTLSWRESFCLPLVEAMMRGLPAVASCWGAAPEVLGDCGITVDPRDPIQAAERVIELIEDDTRRAELSAAARRNAARFTWRRTAELTLSVYEQLLHKKSGNHGVVFESADTVIDGEQARGLHKDSVHRTKNSSKYLGMVL